ncbi:receptor-interacting serine/threonine-protein kinase 2 [Amia ocellicauda]|uniref:receptor-interacting serine/threonine-protein kinase 2 n=1 Tax=Amia ocellicauda TaxID=2972642 RepID=UPI003464B7FE
MRMAQPSPLPTIPEHDVMKMVLTRTSAGSCLRGSYSRAGGCQVAVKVLSIQRTAESQWSESLKEIAKVRRIQSERVLVPLGVYRSHLLLGLVSDWMDEGSLHSLLYERQQHQEVPCTLLLRIMQDVAEGLSHLHSLLLAHQALKPANVLLDAQYRAKVCDFGLSQWKKWNLKSVPADCNGLCIRDLVYLSPETLCGEKPSTEGDIYSFAMLLWETLNRRPPYEDISQPQVLLLSVQSGVGPGIGEELVPRAVTQAPVLSQLIVHCWSYEPHTRPQASDCVLALRRVLETVDPDAVARAAVQLKENKERVLLYSKEQLIQDLHVEVNNLELSGCCCESKSAGTKSVRLETVQMLTSVPERPNPARTSSRKPNGPSPPLPVPGALQTACRIDSWSPPCASPLQPACRVARVSPSRPSSLNRGNLRYSPPPPPPSPPTGTARLHRSVSCDQPQHCSLDSLPGKSCCQILQDYRESILRGMTEGRLNYILDVLRSRQALTREAYELITAAQTLVARTRCLLDTCVCLGEGAAGLVAMALGLVSTSARRSPSQLSY